MVANENFTAIKVIEDGSAKLFVLDNFNGQVRFLRLFQDANVSPVNMAISPDGMLVWTMPDYLCGKDLYEADTKALTFSVYPKNVVNNGSHLYAECKQPSQLLIRSNQILVLQEQGRSVSVHSLEDGILKTYDSGGERVVQIMTAAVQGAANPNGEATTYMRVVGPCVYIYAQRNLLGYHLDLPGEETWRSNSGDPVNLNYRAAVPTRDYIVMVTEPPIRRVGEKVGRVFQLQFYVPIDITRKKGGKVDYKQTITEQAGIVAWQAVEGGIYYLSEDHKLHLFRGTRE